MNNDSTPTSAADLPPTSTTNTASEPIESAESAPSSQDVQKPAQKRAQEQTRKKHEFMTNLLNNLDTLIYAELCILYYMDCSLFRLLLRGLNQMIFLTPKPQFIPPMPQHRPYIGAIFGPAAICIVLHIFTARSEAGEAMRGYLHGGVIVDLIGYKGPTSKIHLVLLDSLVLALQCLMLSVHAETERLKAVLTAFANPTAAAAAAAAERQPRAEVVAAQDLDSEERGLMRDAVTNDGDIELQPMASPNTGPSNTTGNNNESEERNEERKRLLAEPPPREEEEDEHPLDMYYSGQVVIADFHVLHTLKRQWDDYGNASGSALQTVGFSAEFARVAADRRLNAATERFAPRVEAMRGGG